MLRAFPPAIGRKLEDDDLETLPPCELMRRRHTGNAAADHNDLCGHG